MSHSKPCGSTPPSRGAARDDQLFISKKTDNRYRANPLETLGMRNRVELTRYVIRRGLVVP